MNDFTKEELNIIINGIAREIGRAAVFKSNLVPLLDLSEKIQSMIENYRDPNCDHKIDKEIKACKLCLLPSHCIPCVGGWI